MSFKSLFKSFTKKDEEGRTLEHPRDLAKGDMIVLDDSYDLPAQLRGKSLQVTAVQTYQFEYETITEFVLKSDAQFSIFMSVEEEDGETDLVFSVEIPRSTVEQIFDLDQFSTIFDGDGNAEIQVQDEPSDMQGWLSPCYRQTAHGERGYFYSKDYRGQQVPMHEGSGEPFEYYCLVDDDESKQVELEVWEDGDTDVLLSLYRPVSDIRELWPAK